MRVNKRFGLKWTPLCSLLVCGLLLVGGGPAARPGAAKETVLPAGRAAVPAAAVQANSSLVGAWGGVIPMRDVPVHLSALPDGRLLYWGRDKFPDGWDAENGSNTFLWDRFYPEPGLTQLVRNHTTNLFCSGHSFLQDGSLLVSGGHKRHMDPARPHVEGVGEEDLNVFDYRTNQWALLPTQMPNGRWYPHNVTLASGETLFISGTYSDANGTARLNRTPDIFGLDGSLRQAATDPINAPLFATYPYTHLTPDGRVLHAGAFGDQFTRFLTVGPPSSWAFGPEASGVHEVGTSVLYDRGKVMVMSGRGFGGAPSTQAEVIDLNGAPGTQVWNDVSPLNHPRVHPTSTLLPDGTVFVAGGTRCRGANNVVFTNPNNPAQNCFDGQVLNPEIYDPATNAWSVMAPHQEIRVYHSTAILLPDARVLVAGSGLPAAAGENTFGVDPRHYGHKNAEIFSPPYLFESGTTPARRPAITSAPAAAAYGEQFFVGVGNVVPAEVEKVVLVRLGSVTHGFDQDQRRVVLGAQPTPDGAGLLVTAPPNGLECPPGPYMMFLIKSGGRRTPSVAKVIRVGNLALDHEGRAFASGITEGGDGAVFESAGVNVSAAAGLNWTAAVSPGAPWLTIDSGASGTGDGTITYTVAPNTLPGAAPRSAKIVVSVPGQKYTAHEYAVHQASEFTDVARAHPFYLSVAKLYARGITGGCAPNAFCPSDHVTRGQMAAFLTRAMGVTNLPAPPAPTFADVPASHPFYTFVEAIARRGITSGCGGGNFCPDATITRGQMAVFLLSALGVNDPPQPAAQSFADVPPTHPFYRWVEELKRRGITTGCAPNAFCPDAAVPREQMAAFLARAFNL